MDIEILLYEKLCRCCPSERNCFRKGQKCEVYLKELDEEINNDNDSEY